MREINIPLPNISDDEQVEIEVSVDDRKRKYYFRLESIPWEANKKNKKNDKSELSSSERIGILKKAIENYDKSWELIQIFAPLEKSLNIHILYRKK
ncbi:MAG: hypothetical protein DRJ10_08650 [Bacteroidetes bacterium]|nr:MAG: hypothetical protein DRJ10_08650 [Bacteroidota bacterium]